MQSYLTLFLLVHTIEVSPQLPDDDTPIRNLDVFSNKNPKPVPFGHIFKDGIDDLQSDFKVPYDLLELDMKFPKTRHEERRLLKAVPKERIVKIFDDKPVKIYLSPRDEYLDEFRFNKDGDKITTTKSPNNDIPPWFNFEKIQQENIAKTRPAVSSKNNEEKLEKDKLNMPDVNKYIKNQYFSGDTFEVVRESGVDKFNWTTCDEFEKGIKPKNLVYPKDIVNVNWEPFYVWSHRRNVVSNIHKFSYPTKKIVKEYKELYRRYLNKSLDWEQPKLVMKEELEMLLIAGDRRGFFHGIPRHSLPVSARYKNFTIPTVDLRLKIEDPYLAMMYCDEFYATIMASPGNEPVTDKEKREEAALLKFRGLGFPISRNVYLEKLKEEIIRENIKGEDEMKYIKALPGYSGVEML